MGGETEAREAGRYQTHKERIIGCISRVWGGSTDKTTSVASRMKWRIAMC